MRCRTVRAWPASERATSLPDFVGLVYGKVRDTTEEERKKHNTPGFFYTCVETAAESMRAAEGVEYGAEPDWGRFADVGHHTKCKAPTTCWALVVAALESVLAVRSHVQIYCQWSD